MIVGAEMHGFDSDEERLEYLSSLMDSADTTDQQQPQNSGERGMFLCASDVVLGVCSRTSALGLSCLQVELVSSMACIR